MVRVACDPVQRYLSLPCGSLRSGAGCRGWSGRRH